MKSKFLVIAMAVGGLTLLAGEPAPWPLEVGPVGRYQVCNAQTIILGAGSTVEHFTLRLDTTTGQTWILFASGVKGREAVYWRPLDEQPIAAPKLPHDDGSDSWSTKPR